MKTFLYLSALAALLVCGCTRVVVEKPIGSAMAENDGFDLTGEWLGPKAEPWTITSVSNQWFKASWKDDNGKTEEAYFTVTVLTNKVAVVWVKDDELKSYTPLRIAAGDESLALLHPDDVEVKALVESKAIKGEYDKENKAWILSADGLESYLGSKQFWRLDWATAFVRKEKQKPE